MTRNGDNNLFRGLTKRFGPMTATLQATQRLPGTAPYGTGPVYPGSATQSPLTDIFPPFTTIAGGFSLIPGPGVGFAAIPGFAAYYPLIDIDPSSIFGQECSLYAVTVEMISSNNNDPRPVPDPVTQVPWGSKFGTKAAIVVGENIPFQDEGAATRWGQGDCEMATVGGNVEIINNNQFAWSLGFPPGSFSDAIPFKTLVSKHFSPYVVRVPYGTRIQAALAIDAAQIAAAPTLNVVGFVHVQLHLGLMYHTTPYTEQT